MHVHNRDIRQVWGCTSDTSGEHLTAEKLLLFKLEKRAELNESEKVSSRKVVSDIYIRDAFVSEYAKRRAKGICQLCDQNAPFSNKEGIPYLESHHIDWMGYF